MLIEQIAEALSVELEKVTVGRRLAGLSNQVERHAGQVHSVLVPVLGSLRRQRPRNCGVLALPSISSSKGSHSARLAAFFPKAPTQRKSHTPNQKSWTTPQASVGRPHGASSLHAASKPVPRAWNVSDPPAAGGQAQCLHQGHKGRRSVPPNPYAGMALQAATAPDPHGHASFAMVSAASIERLKACAAWPRRTRSEGSKTNSCSRSSSNSRASG